MSKKTLKADYRARNGKRVSHEFPITDEQAGDPLRRAMFVSNAEAFGDMKGWRFVNWTIEG